MQPREDKLRSERLGHAISAVYMHEVTWMYLILARVVAAIDGLLCFAVKCN